MTRHFESWKTTFVMSLLGISCPIHVRIRFHSQDGEIGRASLARENEAGAVGGRRSIYSMITYRTLFCFWS